jgi:hypothetical protein
MNDQRELPCEIARVLHPGVHALSACRTMHVRRIAGEKDPPSSIVGYLAFVDTKGGKPDRIGSAHASGKALIQYRLDFLKGWLGLQGGGVRRGSATRDDAVTGFEGGLGVRRGVLRSNSGIRDDAVAVFGNGEGHHYAVRVPHDVDFGRARNALKVHIGEHPIDRRGLALKLHP